MHANGEPTVYLVEAKNQENCFFLYRVNPNIGHEVYNRAALITILLQ